MMKLFKIERHNPSRSDNIGRLIQSYSADLQHGVSSGDTITAKHFLLAVGVPYITSLQLFLKFLFPYTFFYKNHIILAEPRCSYCFSKF